MANNVAYTGPKILQLAYIVKQNIHTAVQYTVTLLTNINYYVPDVHRERHYEMTAGVCLSVRLSVACLDLTRKRKGLESPKWQDGNQSHE